ncbi:MAG: DUF488 domain-containing protein [Pseudomonadota bacterium]
MEAKLDDYRDQIEEWMEKVCRDIANIYSIGHGNKTFDEFLSILQAYEITCLVDIRSYPHSKRNPHFNIDTFAAELAKVGISYVWLKELGGFRKQGLEAKSPHVALKSQGFRNYADHMFTDVFKQGIDKLVSLRGKGRVSFMCAETLPFRCHRWLLSDYLVSNNVEVVHIIDENKTMVHRLSRYATVRNGHVVYDRLEGEQV